MKKTPLYICGNWKMNHFPSDIEEFFLQFSQFFQKLDIKEQLELKNTNRFQAEIYPATPFLDYAKKCSEQLFAETGFKIQVGSQNIHWEKKGAFTGEVSAGMLHSIGIEYALIGHSERRQFFGETNESVAKRLSACFEQNIIPMVCIGETKQERELGKTKEVLKNQLTPLLPLFQKFSNADTVRIAYEPVWAIGTGLVATIDEANDAHLFISRYLAEFFKLHQLKLSPSILYGGSVTPENSPTLLHSNEIHGALIGGASLKAKSFLEIMLSGR